MKCLPITLINPTNLAPQIIVPKRSKMNKMKVRAPTKIVGRHRSKKMTRRCHRLTKVKKRMMKIARRKTSYKVNLFKAPQRQNHPQSKKDQEPKRVYTPSE